MNSSKPFPLVLIFLIPLFILPSLTISQPAFLSSECVNDDGNYTETSTYKTNLHTLLSTISSKSQIDYGFLNISVGQGMDVVHGIALCRVDISMSQCHTCLRASTSRIIQDCPNQRDAVGWFDNCMIWYSNDNIFNGRIDFGDYNKTDTTNKPIDLKTFNHTVGSLLMKLAQQAASGDTRRKFEMGEVNVSRSIKIYALAQCTPNLQDYDCFSCLKEVIEDILAYCCYGNQAAKAAFANCNVQYQNYQFYGDVSPLPPLNSLPVSPPSPTVYRKGGKNRSKWKILTVILVLLVTCLTLLVATFLCFWYLRRQNGLRTPWKKGAARVEVQTSESLQMDFGTIKAATDNFSYSNKLGRGGFGTVYKGILPTGQVIAVKRLSQNSGQGEEEFKNEAVLVARLQHRNLVRFMGFCLEDKERLLIYELLPNKSLDYHLFDPIKRVNLNWETRYKIIRGIARGLLYLHEDSRLLVVHRDLKPSNILLDAEMNPKISDFGMARLFGADQTTGHKTTKICGTYGYMPPEYVLHGHFSIKSDIFSFDVLLLEIISGQSTRSFDKSAIGETLLGFAWNNWLKGTAINVVDSTMSSYDTTEALRCIHIGLLCVQEDVDHRPIMSSIVLMLNSNTIAPPMPSCPAFLFNDKIKSINQPPKFSSLNEVSMSVLDAR